MGHVPEINGDDDDDDDDFNKFLVVLAWRKIDAAQINAVGLVHVCKIT